MKKMREERSWQMENGRFGEEKWSGVWRGVGEDVRERYDGVEKRGERGERVKERRSEKGVGSAEYIVEKEKERTRSKEVVQEIGVERVGRYRRERG